MLYKIQPAGPARRLATQQVVYDIRSTRPVSPVSTGWLQLIAFHGIRYSVGLQASILQSHDAVHSHAGATQTVCCTNVWKCFGQRDATIGPQLSNKNEIIYNIILFKIAHARTLLLLLLHLITHPTKCYTNSKVRALSEKNPTLNKCVFKCFAKVAGPTVRFLNSTGNSFQQLGPATAKALKPQSVLWLGTTRSPRTADLKADRPETAEPLVQKQQGKPERDL